MQCLSMRAVVCTALFLCIGLLTSGCSKESVVIDADSRVLAEVNDHEITVSWFEQTYINFLIQTGQNDDASNRRIHLENLIDALLLADEFENQGLTESESYARYYERRSKSVLADRYFDETFLANLEPPSEAELRRTYALSKDQVVVRHLFFSNPTLAAESYERLKNGTSFLDEAQVVYGTTEYDSTAGYLGPVKYFSVDDAFGVTAFNLEVGQYSEPIRSRFGYHIIQVENRLIEPLLTESAYQTAKGGISSQFRLRKRRLEGDSFVRTFMEARNVDVDGNAIKALQSFLADFAVDVAPKTSILPAGEQNFQLDSLRQNINLDTVLGSFEWEGTRENFTTGHYLFWLEDLPFQEALHRTAASVGRAMRNELLSRAGKESGYQDDKAAAILDREVTQAQASFFRVHLRETPAENIDESLIKQAFETMGMVRQLQFRADFELVPFKTRAEAENVALGANEGSLDLSTMEGFEAGTDTPLIEIPFLAQHIRNAPLNTHIVVGLYESWAVLFVTKREKEEINWDDHRESIIQRLAPFASEYQIVKRLRAESVIKVDSVLFQLLQAFDS